MNVQDVVAAINWEDLRLQKEWLLQFSDDPAEGLLNLLDALQDAAVDSGLVSFNEVFGDDIEDEVSE